MTDAAKEWAREMPKVISTARAAYGHMVGITTEECLALSVWHLRGLMSERNDALNLNAAQAQQIARISAENDRLRKALSEESK